MVVAPVDRKTEILDAAAALFARRGFKSVGMDDIAAAVGVSGPSLYWHFASKDEILTALLAEAADHFADGLAKLAAAPSVAPSDLARMIFERFLQAPDHSATLVREGHRATGVAAERRRRVDDQAREVARRLQAELPFRLEPELLAMRIRATIGAAVALTFAPPPLPRRRIQVLGVTAVAAMLGVPPRPPRPVSEQAKWQPRRSRREQILVAARELFETKGFHSVTVNDIGQSLGMRGPSIYRHFASKRELLAAAWDREATRFVAGTLDALRDARSPDDALGLLAASIAQVLVGSEALIRMTYLDLDDDPEYVGSWVAWRPFVVEVWCDVLAEIRDDLSDPEVRFIVEMTHATMVQAANDAAGRPTWVDEIANLGVALATARPPDH